MGAIVINHYNAGNHPPRLSRSQSGIDTLRCKQPRQLLPTLTMRVAASRRAHRCAGASSSPLVVAAFTALASASVALAASSTPCVIQGSSIGKFDLRGLRNKKRESPACPRLEEGLAALHVGYGTFDTLADNARSPRIHTDE